MNLYNEWGLELFGGGGGEVFSRGGGRLKIISRRIIKTNCDIQPTIFLPSYMTPPPSHPQIIFQIRCRGGRGVVYGRGDINMHIK